MTKGAADTQSLLAELEALAHSQTSRPEPVFDPPTEPVRPAPPLAISADGHRARIRARLLQAGPDAIADHELLEMVLFLALPRRDTKPIARALLARFKSFAAAISASPADLVAIEGMGEAAAAALKIVQAAAHRLARASLNEQPLLGNHARSTTRRSIRARCSSARWSCKPPR